MAAHPITLRLFGRFELMRTAHPIELHSRKARALLALLALSQGRRRSRGQLSAMLWGHTGDQRARHNLRQCVAAIRRALDPDGDEILLADGDDLVLTPACAVDADQLTADLDAEEPERLERALERSPGELMSQFFLDIAAFDAWLDEQRRRFRERACAACARLVAAYQQRDDADAALTAARRWLGLDEASEAAHRTAMTLLAKLDRRSEALAQYERCAEALARHYEAEPEAETRALHQAIRDGNLPPGDAARGAVRAARSGAPDGPASAPSAAPARPRPPAAPAAPRALPTIAVLPFENLGADDDHYYAVGIAEDIITEMTRFQSLVVIARQSSFAYRQRTLAVPDIAAALGVQYVVDGSVRRSREQVRISVHLIDGPSGRHLWANRYTAPPDGILDVETEVLQTIVATLAGRVEAARLGELRRDATAACAAHDYVLRGKELHHRGGADNVRAAIEMFTRAIALDSQYALAHAWLSCSFGLLAQHEEENAHAIIERSAAAAERARELDDSQGECHRLLAAINILRHRFDLAEFHQHRALALTPNDDRIVCQMGELLSIQGRPEAALPWVDKAMRLNPFHGDNMFWHRGRILYQLGRPAEALKELDRIARSSVATLALAVACAQAAGVTPRPRVERVQAVRPDFSVATFLASLPLACERTVASLRDDLIAAGLPA